MITPIQGRVLVELKGAYDHIDVTEEKYGATKNRGIVRGIAKDIAVKCKELGIKVGSMVYFGKFEDNAPVDLDGQPGTLLKLEEIGGVDD